MMMTFGEPATQGDKKRPVKRTTEQEWERIRTAILNALEPFPGAREAVVAALMDLRAADEGAAA